MAAEPRGIDKGLLTRSLKSLLTPIQKKQDRQMMGCLWTLVLLAGIYALAWKILSFSWWGAGLLSLGVSTVFGISFFVVFSEEREVELVLGRFERRYPRSTESPNERLEAVRILRRLGDPNKSYFMQAAQTLLQALDNQAELHGDTPESQLAPVLSQPSGEDGSERDTSRQETSAETGPPKTVERGGPMPIELIPSRPDGGQDPQRSARAEAAQKRIIPLEPDHEHDRRDD